MSVVNKVVWSEGMFLRHQHFQQLDRNREYLLSQIMNMYHASCWGLSSLKIDTESLKTGKFILTKCSGVFSDGTLFDSDTDTDVPMAITLPVTAHNCIIYLAIPLRQVDLTETRTTKDTDNNFARYVAKECQVRGDVSTDHDAAEIYVSRLQLRLLTDFDDMSQFSCIPVARVFELKPDGSIDLDDKFIPTCVSCNASEVLQKFLLELQSLLSNRSTDLAGRIGTSSNVDSVTDFLLLQLVNRYSAYIANLAVMDDTQPLQVFNTCLQLCGEMCTYNSDNKRLKEKFSYKHSDLTTSFSPLIARLRSMLTSVMDQPAYRLDLQQSKQGIWVSLIKDPELLTTCSFILAVNADMPMEELNNRVITQIKVGPVEKIRSLINLQLVGVELKQLSVIPREIPYHTGNVYFELDKSSQIWKEMQSSSAFAVHFSGDFLGLEVELWAVKE
ncbi:MAG: type VI secretion system baseplate subunit TssK [Gammaproteobacteria bacterium]|nr:type VI secretion system baseplate subunit TssK [Gammaproteobacteria bacterium]MCH9743710.1 type VI secretion system baseplate subunit TssK [Gammaproteobacteria bacterium]